MSLTRKNIEDLLTKLEMNYFKNKIDKRIKFTVTQIGNNKVKKTLVVFFNPTENNGSVMLPSLKSIKITSIDSLEKILNAVVEAVKSKKIVLGNTYSYKGSIITASSKKEAILMILGKAKTRLTEKEFKANYNKVFDYCKSIKINPCNEMTDSKCDGDSFTFGVNNDWNTVDVYYDGKFGYSLNDGEKYNKTKLTFEELKKVLDKYAEENKDKLKNNKVVTRQFV